MANPRTVSNAPIVESVSYSHLTLDSGEIKTVNLSLDEAEVTNTSEDLRTSVIEIKGKNEIITNFNVDVADGYTYKIFTDEDLTNELDLTNLNIKTSKIYIVIYDSNGEEFDLLEYDFVIDYSFHASGDDNRSLDNIETYYFTDEKFTLEFVSGNSDVKISSKLYVFENNKIKEIESLNLGEVVDAELVMEIGYGGNTYKYTKNVVAIYSLDFKEFIEEVENFGTLTFSGKKIEENSVEVSCELSECKVLMLSLRGGSYSISIESKKLINVGERYFLSFALIDTDKEDAGTFVIELIYIEE